MAKPVVNPAASVSSRLLAYARDKGLAFDLVLTRFALERLLDRLSRSPYTQRFVLKGGMLVMIWFDEPLRGTRDLDLLGFGDATPEGLHAAFTDILAMPGDDPLVFDHAALSVMPIRGADQYGGVRLRTTAALANTRIPVVIDVAFGDAVEPGLISIDYPVLLDLPRPRIRAYAPETVIAEKFQAMVALGRANSRMKDIFDVWSIFNAYEIDQTRLATALTATFARRGTPLPDGAPDALTEAFSADPAKVRQWRAFVSGLSVEPPALLDAAAAIAARLMPVMAAARAAQTSDALRGPAADASSVSGVPTTVLASGADEGAA